MPECPEHSGIVARLDEHKRRLDEGMEKMDKIFVSIDEIKNGLTRRPPWAVSILITALCSLVVGLVVALVRIVA